MIKDLILGSTGYVAPSGWNISTLTYDNKSLNTPDQTAIYFYIRPDGLKMYLITTLDGKVREYNLATAWDISTATQLQSDNKTIYCLFFKPDGTGYYGNISSNTISYIPLSTPWNITTDGTRVDKNVGESASSIFFKPDGTMMYYGTGYQNTYVKAYSLSTAWDITTATYVNSFTTTTWCTDYNFGLWFSPNGDNMYTSDLGKIHQFSLGTSWNVSTASFVRTYDYSEISNSTYSRSIGFNPDGTKHYILSSSFNGKIYQYSLTS